MAQEPEATGLPPGVIPAHSEFSYERVPVMNLDPEIQSVLIDALVEGESKVRHQAATAEEEERAKVQTVKGTSARVTQAIKDGEKAKELERLGKLERSKKEDEALKLIAETTGTDVMNAILGDEVLDAARDMQEAARNYDVFMENRGEQSGLMSAFGAFSDRSKHNKLARDFNRAEERFLSLQQGLQQAAQTASMQAKAAKDLQPTSPHQYEQDADRLRNAAASSVAQAQETERLAGIKADSEARIIELKKQGLAGLNAFFDTYAKINQASASGMDAELRARQLAQMDAGLAEVVMRPEQSEYILKNTQITANQLATMSAAQRVTALKLAGGQPVVSNLTDQTQITDAAAVVNAAHPNPVIKYLFKQLAPTINQDASMVQQGGAAFDALPEDKKEKARKEGARKQKEFENFIDARPVEFIDGVGRKETKTTSQWVADRFMQDPAGSGMMAFTNKYADDYVKSGRKGAKVIETIRTNIAGKSLQNGQLIDLDYWRAAAGNDAEAMYDAIQFIQEQVVNNTPWREYGLKAPEGVFNVTYGARSMSWLPYKQVSKQIRSVEDVTHMFIQMDNVKKAENYFQNSKQIGEPISPFPSKEEAKANFGKAITDAGDALFGDDKPDDKKDEKKE